MNSWLDWYGINREQNGCFFSRKVVLPFWRRTKLRSWRCSHCASSMLWNSRSPTTTNLYLFNSRITGRNTCCCSARLEAPFLSSSVQNRGNALFWTLALTIKILCSWPWVLSNAMTNWLPTFTWRAITSLTIGNHSTSMLSALIFRNRCMWRRRLLCKIGNCRVAANRSILTSFWVGNNLCEHFKSK